jgi:hypothetical protein
MLYCEQLAIAAGLQVVVENQYNNLLQMFAHPLVLHQLPGTFRRLAE